MKVQDLIEQLQTYPPDAVCLLNINDQANGGNWTYEIEIEQVTRADLKEVQIHGFIV